MLEPIEKKQASWLDARHDSKLRMPIQLQFHDPSTWPTRLEIGLDQDEDVQINISPAVLPDTIVRIRRDQIATLAHALLAFAPSPPRHPGT